MREHLFYGADQQGIDALSEIKGLFAFRMKALMETAKALMWSITVAQALIPF